MAAAATGRMTTFGSRRSSTSFGRKRDQHDLNERPGKRVPAVAEMDERRDRQQNGNGARDQPDPPGRHAGHSRRRDGLRGGRRAPDLETRRDPRRAARLAHDRELASEQLDALAHPDETEASPLRRAACLEAAAVVLDHEREPLAVAVQVDRNLGCRGMLGDIRERGAGD